MWYKYLRIFHTALINVISHKNIFKGLVKSLTQNCIQNETVVSISEKTTIYSGYEEHCHLCNFHFCIFNLFRILIIRIYVAKKKDQS